MIIDCDSCQVRGLACHDCVVAVLIGPPADLIGESPEPGAAVETVWTADERRALAVLAQAGLVPPLRLAGPVTNDTPAPGRRAV
jgi:hypothetical protein